MRLHTTALAFAALLLTGAAEAPVVRAIRFAAGTSGGVVEGSVVRGEMAYYSLAARAGQTLSARVTAEEDNAVFQLYAPGARVALRDGEVEMTGTALPRAGEGDDARSWRGKLPATGSYLFVVGGTRGNASYRLTVTVQ